MLPGPKAINVVGICCTGNELLQRHAIPSCTHSVSQEMALLTGALDAIVVDYQCIMPSLVTVAECMGSKIITTMDICKITGAQHIEFTEEAAAKKAKEAIRAAIQVFKKRKGQPVDIPDVESTVVAGFSTESIVAALAKVDAKDPLKPLVDNIKNGNIRGVCLFAGCNNVKVPQDRNFKIMAENLLRENVLVVATGCGAGALMRHGFMDPANVGSLVWRRTEGRSDRHRRSKRTGRPASAGAPSGFLRRQLACGGDRCCPCQLPGGGYRQTACCCICF